MQHDASGLAATIRARTHLRPLPALPDICIHMAHPGSGLHGFTGSRTPYWAYPWAGGLALARHVTEVSEVVAGRSVLDLGCGSGIVGIAAARAGAGRVVASDTDPCALSALALNAAANGVEIEALAGDLLAGPPPDVDVVLVGDLFYARALARRVTNFLNRCADAGITALVGDPGRAFLPRSRLRPVAVHEVRDFASGALAPGLVLSFERAASP